MRRVDRSRLEISVTGEGEAGKLIRRFGPFGYSEMVGDPEIREVMLDYSGFVTELPGKQHRCLFEKTPRLASFT
jgi:hypothetical protein